MEQIQNNTFIDDKLSHFGPGTSVFIAGPDGSPETIVRAEPAVLKAPAGVKSCKIKE